MEEQNKKQSIFWTAFFSIISIVLFNLALFFPEQRIIIFGFTITSVIFALVIFYIQKINFNENHIKDIREQVSGLSTNLTERFNYLRDLTEMKADIKMLKNKRKGQINLLDIIKILVAIILIYVIISVLSTI